MNDWLQNFGKFDTSLLDNGNNGFYIPTNDKSLVVSGNSVQLDVFIDSITLDVQVSILSAGTFFGALLAFPMGDRVGRKWGLVAACAVFSLGVGLQLDTRWATFIVGRVIAGLGVVSKNTHDAFICACSDDGFSRVSSPPSCPCTNQR